jgi:hypothetical protein
MVTFMPNGTVDLRAATRDESHAHLPRGLSAAERAQLHEVHEYSKTLPRGLPVERMSDILWERFPA